MITEWMLDALRPVSPLLHKADSQQVTVNVQEAHKGARMLLLDQRAARCEYTCSRQQNKFLLKIQGKIQCSRETSQVVFSNDTS